MTDAFEPSEDPSDDELSALAAILRRSDVWDDAPVTLDDSILAAITAESAASESSSVTAPGRLSDQRAARDARRSGRASSGRAMPWWLAAAAVCAVVGAGIAISRIGRGTDEGSADAVIALAGTDLAPGASARAELSSTPAGLKILLDTDGLRGAGDGQMYEAWVSDGTIRVSAGTFHLRGGDGPIELWAGTDDPRFTILAVTLEPIDGDTDSSGQVVLRGEFTLAD